MADPKTTSSEPRLRVGNVVRFVRNRGGAAAIEFALVFPLMALLIAGTVDLGLGLMINRKVNQVATATSDIVSQEDDWTGSQLDTLLSGVSTILTPFETKGLKIVVSVLDFDGAGKGKVHWSRAYQAESLAPGASWPSPVSANFVEPGVQLVVTEVEYSGKSALTGLLYTFAGVEIYNFASKAIARPRGGDTIEGP